MTWSHQRFAQRLIPWPEAVFDPISFPQFPETHLHRLIPTTPFSFLPAPGLLLPVPARRDHPCPARPPHLSATHPVTPDNTLSLCRSHSRPAFPGFPPPQHPHSTQHTAFAHTVGSASLYAQILQLLPTSSEFKPKDWHRPHPLPFRPHPT